MPKCHPPESARDKPGYPVLSSPCDRFLLARRPQAIHPGVSGLVDVAEDALPDALRTLLGMAADGATIRVSGKMVSLDYGDLPESTLMEAQRLCEKAAVQSNKGQFSKAA